MLKKRVYELAKELGVENKELIARLEKMGITVKTHSSGLEDSDVERVRREYQAAEAHEVVEKRVKATVIRRRAVRTVTEEAPVPAPEPAEPETVRKAGEEGAPAAPVTEPPAVVAVKTPPEKEAAPPPTPPEPVPPPPAEEPPPAPQAAAPGAVIQMEAPERTPVVPPVTPPSSVEPRVVPPLRTGPPPPRPLRTERKEGKPPLAPRRPAEPAEVLKRPLAVKIEGEAGKEGVPPV